MTHSRRLRLPKIGTLPKMQRILIAAGLIALSLLIDNYAQLIIGNYAQLAQAASLVMVMAALPTGLPIFKKAFASLRYRIVGIDALVTVAVIGAMFIGEYWEAAAVTFLFSLGDYLESRTLEKTRSSIKALLELAPLTARVIRNDEEKLVPVEELVIDDTVVIRSGERLAIDGLVTEGYGSLNQAAITGEPLAVEALPGTNVYSGSILETGYLLVRAQRVGDDTSFARILHMVEEAQDRKAPTQKFLERFSRYYTPGILILAVVLGIISLDIHLALTLLVIACPGALVISAPVSIVSGIGRGARQGILVKGGDSMERMGAVRALALDKTGTLTEGKPQVVDLVALNGMTEEKLMALAASGEAYSEHPLGSAIVRHAREVLGEVAHPKPESSRIIPGQGMEFTLSEERYFLGNRRLLSGQGIEIDRETEKLLAAHEDRGRTAVLVGTAQRTLGIIAIADTLRPGAADLVSRLRTQGVRHIAMLTGDNRRTAQALAAELGIDAVHYELLPEDKVEVLRTIQKKHGRTAMLGDGINDAPALASADLGIALGGGGSDIAMETADVVLLSSRLENLVTALGLSRATVRNMKQNIVFALAVAGLLLAGVLVKTVNLSFGMLIHELSVLMVILNALRLIGHGRKSAAAGRAAGQAAEQPVRRSEAA